MKKRSDNRGFTLVELIIAVAILAIAISPLIANFIQSSKLNLKGRKSLNAMNLAQDVMEGMSGYTADEVTGVIDGVISDNTLSLAGAVLPHDSSYTSLSKTSAPSDSVLKYKIAGVKTISGSSSKYNVELTFDPTGTDQAAFNGKDIADITEVDQYFDAIYTCPTAEINEAMLELHGKSNMSEPLDAYRGNMMRTIKLKIENEGSAVAPKYKVTVTREYKVTPDDPDGPAGPKGGFATDTDLVGENFTTPATGILKSDVTQKPRSIYLYFEGLYGATNSVPTIRDNIEIESTIGEEITVYLLQQAGATYDPNYACNVKIKSKDLTGLVDTDDVHIVSNIRYDLSAAQMRYNFRDEKEDGTAIPITDYPLISDSNKLEDIGPSSYQTSSSYDRTRANYYYNNDMAKIDEARYQSNFTAGYARDEKNTLYKVKIDVYDATTGERVAQYNGGLSN